MMITEEFFREAFLEELRFIGYSDEEYLTEPLNGKKICYACEDFQFFLYHFLKDNNLPLEICGNFPWTKYFKGFAIYEIQQYFRKWLGKEYDKDYFEPEQPLYYETLKNHLFSSLEKMENEMDKDCLG